MDAMHRIAAAAADHAVALDEPMNLVILGATGLATIAFLALVGAFAASLRDRG